jgi:hypothetical protein
MLLKFIFSEFLIFKKKGIYSYISYLALQISFAMYFFIYR